MPLAELKSEASLMVLEVVILSFEWGPIGPPVSCSAARRVGRRCDVTRRLVAPARLVRLQQVMRVAPSDGGLCELRGAATHWAERRRGALRAKRRRGASQGGEHSPPDSQSCVLGCGDEGAKPPPVTCDARRCAAMRGVAMRGVAWALHLADAQVIN